MNQDLHDIIKFQIKKIREEGMKYDRYENILTICREGFNTDVEHKWEYKYYTDYVKKVALKNVNDESKESRKKRWRTLYWDSLKAEAYHFFESFLYYMELKRPYEKRFYEPREKTLKVVVDDLQKLEDSTTQRLYALSMPARVGKSTLILFFMAWHILRSPLSHNAMGTHAGMLAEHFYKEMLDLFTSADYTFQDLYAYYHPGENFIEDKSADKLSISFGSKGDFATFTARGIDGTWTGAIDISADGFLAVDDLVRDRAHSLSPKRMNDTFSEYLNKMVDRTNDGAKQLLIGTLWNVLDPIKRLEEMYAGDDRYVFRKLPALNENDESNFQYDVKGFSTQYYHEMRDRLCMAGNEAEWQAKYQQNPYVREGILFPVNELGFFNGILPIDHTYEAVACCDVAFGGGDSVSMPVGLMDKDTDILYIVDWYFSSAGVQTTVPGICDMIIKHELKAVTIEKNNGGQLFADKIREELKARGYLCSIDTKRAPNNISKEDKIKSVEGEVKSRIRFLDGSEIDKTDIGDVTYYSRSIAYSRALDEMTTYVTIGKNLHDDAADSIAQLCDKAFSRYRLSTMIMASPF